MAATDVRERALKRYREGTTSVEEIAEEAGVSRATLYNWVNAAGLSGQRRSGGSSRTEAEESLSMVTAELEKIDDACRKIDEQIREFAEWRTLWWATLSELRSDVKTLQQGQEKLHASVARLGGMVEVLAGVKQQPQLDAGDKQPAQLPRGK